MPHPIPPFINYDPWDSYQKNGSGPVKLILVLIPPCRLTAAKSSIKRLLCISGGNSILKGPTLIVIYKQLFLWFLLLPTSKGLKPQPQQEDRNRVVLWQLQQTQTRPDRKPLFSWMSKHSQRYYTSTVSSPNAKRLRPPCNEQNQPAMCLKQTVQASKTFLKTSRSIKGSRITLLFMCAPVGHPLSDEFTLLFHCKLLFTTEHSELKSS